MYHITLCMSEIHGVILARTFQHNYPNYTINFTFSKVFPLNCIQIERNTLWICDRDDQIQCIVSQLRQYPTCFPPSLPLPVIAFSHSQNKEEELMGPMWMICSPDELSPQLIEEIFCRCQGLPLTIACTRRCMIRELTIHDLPSLLLLQLENKKNPGGCFFPEDCAAPDVFLNDYIRHQYLFYGYGLFGIFHRYDGEFLGIGGFSPTDLSSEDAEISYALLRKYQHHGYACEAVKMLLSEGVLRWQLKKVTARIAPDNSPSIRLADKLHIHYISDPCSISLPYSSGEEL